ncbi:3,4-dihydroxy-2-butanone-4-phosphate synthase [Methermicoccus shengliensis]|uniref:3,4-dihydroxy-2-butanone 4-phosphate synthase n=1 Tax=Methermicoccus shengliensis TaxID=660064 RepID=A0A832RVZ1_9EURY|nr:3,4-dihydroxy-2-butanone-4-phosphate synthase [Methermicoccus shengliensis]KUK03965.1 MAG: 3,4-dihydroxy-2-butanone 4-phosphate synthase [Euryarchaeota archaeon 55_53]KUK29644.1 MAG: 3,4-dihydroxy-2-butanone 4-phosphate synthase [Methanosarcinales archeaon 56_1174]MDI3488691.1 3,4-dihydroxy 2-butanone 4-phosphate synthase [Methanosarcinales archaeon]MDN5294760.1 3,4-dihydroxy 2-butanone 4-phosphate synthase [Methanosarcinales archaeon]HIH69474.1 3,4-dihydroxy-2-butanone-4-phosphate synthase
MLQEAIEQLRRGRPVLLFDFEDREGETDFVFPATHITPADIRLMRKEGGGLICVAIHPEAASRLSLPLISDVLLRCGGDIASLVERRGDLRYDSRSSFSLWVNHRSVFTGIPDRDRALTIREIGNAVERVMRGEHYVFHEHFRTPGHVAILRASEGLLESRRGQTELSVALAMMAHITPAMAICEMLDDESGNALSKDAAKRYARLKGIPFVEGSEVVRAYKNA